MARPLTSEQAREREADRQRKLATLQVRLHDAAALLRASAEWERCLRLAALMPGEDFANILLIASQRPGATVVRDYRQWAAVGRQVRRGETGIEIFHLPSRPPRQHKQQEDEHNPTWRDADRVGYVWDLSQTTGQPGDAHTDLPAGQTPAKLWDALTWLARREGYAVDHEHGAPADGTTFWAAHRIRLPPDLSGEQAVWALAHQLGHILLHTMPGYPATATTYGCAGIRKAEADAVALIVCAHHGIEGTQELSRPSSWAGSDPRAQPAAAILAAGQRIITASRRIVRHTDRILRGDDPELADSQAPRPATPAQISIRTNDVAPPHGAGLPSGPARGTSSVLVAAQEFYTRQFANSWAPAYLRTRGITDAISRDWGIGYAPAGWTTLTDYLRCSGYSDSEIQAAGLAKPSSRGTLIDLFRDRVMLPVHDENGTLAGFIARAHPGASHIPKYLNSPETDQYKKGELLFGLHHARPALAHGAVPVIVEGPFDAIAVTLADPAHYAGLAPCGTALTSQQAALLGHTADLDSTGMLIAFDGDAAGRKAAIRSYSILRPFTWKLLSVSLSGKDPAEIVQNEGTAALRSALEGGRQPLSAMVIDARIDTWEQRLRDADGPYWAMLSGASLIADLLPDGTARQIQAITGNRELHTLDELLHPVGIPELTQIVPLLPADTTYQIARIADRLGFDYSDVLTEVANTITRRTAPPKGQDRTPRNSQGSTQQIRRPTAAQLARISFPRPLTSQATTDYSPPRPASPVLAKARSHRVPYG